MLTFFIGFLTVVLAIVCLLMVFIVLMQRPKQEGLGAAFGGGVTDQVFGAQTTNVLQRGTVYLAVMFFAITLILAVLVNAKQKGAKDLDKGLAESDPAPAVAPADPSMGSTEPNFDNISLTEVTPGADKPDTSVKLDAPVETPAPAETTPAETTTPSGAAPETDPAAALPTEPADLEGDAADAVKKLLEEAEAGGAIEAVEEAVEGAQPE